MKIKTFRTVIFSFVFFCSQSAFSAVSSEEILQRLNELSTIIQKQQKEIEKLRQDLRDRQKSIHQAQNTEKEEIQKAVKTENVEKERRWSDWVPKWARNIKIAGDLRLRYEGLYNRQERQADGSTDDVPTRDRYRIRARLFVDGKINEEVSAHFMICTNDNDNLEATATNQSFSDDFNDKGIYLHRAYGTYKPKWFPGLEITAGKFKNTFLHTDIMWDPDVNPEGIYERYQYQGWENFKPFIHLGQMAVNEENRQTDDAALYINQLGFDWKIGPVTWILAGSYYDWANLHNTEFLNTADYRKGGGNTFVLDPSNLPNVKYLYDYNLWEAITFLKFKLGPVPTELMFDCIVNSADDVPGAQDTAYFAGFKLGKEKKKGDWSLFYKYARIEKDAVIGAMNDQDFYGANRKGHKIMFRYMLLDELRFGTAFFYTDPVKAWDTTSPTFNNNKDREHEDRFQTEFLLKF